MSGTWLDERTGWMLVRPEEQIVRVGNGVAGGSICCRRLKVHAGGLETDLSPSVPPMMVAVLGRAIGKAKRCRNLTAFTITRACGPHAHIADQNIWQKIRKISGGQRVSQAQ